MCLNAWVLYETLLHIFALGHISPPCTANVITIFQTGKSRLRALREQSELATDLELKPR